MHVATQQTKDKEGRPRVILTVSATNTGDALISLASTVSTYPFLSLTFTSSGDSVPNYDVDIDADEEFWDTNLSDFVFLPPGKEVVLSSGTFSLTSCGEGEEEAWRYCHWSEFEDYMDARIPRGSELSAAVSFSPSDSSYAVREFDHDDVDGLDDVVELDLGGLGSLGIGDGGDQYVEEGEGGEGMVRTSYRGSGVVEGEVVRVVAWHDPRTGNVPSSRSATLQATHTFTLP